MNKNDQKQVRSGIWPNLENGHRLGYNRRGHFYSLTTRPKTLGRSAIIGFICLILLTGLLLPTATLADQGRLTIQLAPEEALLEGAAWSVDGGRTWLGGGQVTTLPAGWRKVVFQAPLGWGEPAPREVEIISGETARLEIEFPKLARECRLIVDLVPKAVAQSGAAWSIDDGRTWFPSGEMVELPAGAYTLTFRKIKGYQTPDPEPLNLARGDKIGLEVGYGRIQTNPSAGALIVTILPPEANAEGAAWSVDAGDNWFPSGYKITLDPGVYRLRWKKVPGWTSPLSYTTEIGRNRTTKERMSYSR